MTKLRFLFPIILVALAGCGSPENAENTQLETIFFSYEIDTVYIDAKDEFLFLNMGLFFSDYSAKDGALYNLNSQSGRVEIIDLKNKTLERLVQYDLDGPNSIIEMALTGIKKADNGSLFFMNYMLMNQLDSMATKIASYRLSNEFLKGDDLKANEEIDGMGQIANDGSYFASVYGVYQTGGTYTGLAKVTFADSSLQLIPLDFWADMDKYNIKMDVGDGRAFSSPEYKFLTLDGNNLILSTTAKNELWYYEAAMDSTFHKEYSSAFTQNEKVVNYPKTANSQESFDQANKQKNDQVVFGPLVKDENLGRFYRYSREGDDSENNYAYVLTIFDEKLNQLHEEKMRDEVTIPGHYFAAKTFVHQGMLYTFLNIGDELAFIRLKPNFHDE
ncbi:uncharacterized protein DUF4221 [Algoriphagus ratkowskyi]|uniref:DUF4221 domain-containing protein n=1 Tax=Algoriphagus ratkowskyi TaxID=57028 RepID=A0A2W7R5U2_9BACT|nr:DUF4221 family protein [Algoriphagus ratkowskyi]PZX54546.1 uncharacterized protein DUF4221 [Algoriphagus ratkowskyi]TXD76865.1 DUF4221 domain-containing protein [Algoriphagus ratkowskyi]